MSVDALFWALHEKVERPSDKLTLLCLANYANHEGLAYPSIARLCDDTSLNRKTVLAALQRLVAGGWIADTGKRAGHTKGVVVYQMVPKTGQLNSPENGTAPAEAVPLFPPSSPTFSRKQSLKRDTEPVREPVTEPKEKGVAPPPPQTWLTPAAEAWESTFGQGSFNAKKAAGSLARLHRAGNAPELIGAHLRQYLATLDNPKFASLARFAETFADHDPAKPSANGKHPQQFEYGNPTAEPPEWAR